MQGEAQGYLLAGLGNQSIPELPGVGTWYKCRVPQVSKVRVANSIFGAWTFPPGKRRFSALGLDSTGQGQPRNF